MIISLDPGTSALLVIDVQKGLFSRPTPVYHEQQLLDNINYLSDQFLNQGGAVFFIQHSNQKYWRKVLRTGSSTPGSRLAKTIP